MLGVVDNNSYGLARIHSAAAADGNNEIGSRSLKGGHAALHVFNGGVGLHVVKYGVSYFSVVQHLQHLGRNLELHKAFIRHHKRLLKAPGRYLIGNYRNRTGPKIRGFIEYKSVSHNNSLLLFFLRLYFSPLLEICPAHFAAGGLRQCNQNARAAIKERPLRKKEPSSPRKRAARFFQLRS